jgi:hypothetical protein
MILLLALGAWLVGGAVLSIPVACMLHRGGRDLATTADEQLAASADG